MPSRRAAPHRAGPADAVTSRAGRGKQTGGGGGGGGRRQRGARKTAEDSQCPAPKARNGGSIRQLSGPKMTFAPARDLDTATARNDVSHADASSSSRHPKTANALQPPACSKESAEFLSGEGGALAAARISESEAIVWASAQRQEIALEQGWRGAPTLATPSTSSGMLRISAGPGWCPCSPWRRRR
jgi:hypothetical protein